MGDVKKTQQKIYECGHCGRTKKYEVIVGTIGPMICSQCGGPLHEEGEEHLPGILECEYE